MAIELITGRYGTAHIGSEDVRAYQAYTAGSGRYVLHGGGASIQSANDVHVNPAEILIDGAHVRITGTGEDVTIDNGASSYKRVDIIALHYKMTGDGDTEVESVTLDVVKGTPADSDPQDPDMPATGSILDNVSETYVPYVRVLIDGLTPQTPTVLLPDYVNPSDPTGDGEQVNPSLLVNLASSAAADVFQESPRPGVTGTLPVSHGGTGSSSRGAALYNLMVSGYVESDFNNYTTPGCYTVNGASNYANYPISNGKACYDWGVLQVIPGGNVGTLVQIYWPNSSNDSPYFRSAGWGGVTSWLRLASALDVYPVGAVYISYVSTSPASLFGGSWTAITGRFPYFNAGTGTGGSNTHTLSVSEMPSHRHDFKYAMSTSASNVGGGASIQGSSLSTNPVTYTDANSNYVQARGGSAAHNNMPAYQTLYAWRRTA